MTRILKDAKKILLSLQRAIEFNEMTGEVTASGAPLESTDITWTLKKQIVSVRHASEHLRAIGNILTAFNYKLRGELELWLDQKKGTLTVLSRVVERCGVPFGAEVVLVDDPFIEDLIGFVPDVRPKLPDVQAKIFLKVRSRYGSNAPPIFDGKDHMESLVISERMYGESLLLPPGVVSDLRAIVANRQTSQAVERLEKTLDEFDRLIKSLFSQEDILSMLVRRSDLFGPEEDVSWWPES
jgi:hypothetical protein